jgi:hypothetical protein
LSRLRNRKFIERLLSSMKASHSVAGDMGMLVRSLHAGLLNLGRPKKKAGRSCAILAAPPHQTPFAFDGKLVWIFIKLMPKG